MACRTALLGFVAAVLAGGCNRADVPPRAAETVASMADRSGGQPPTGTVVPSATRRDGRRLAEPVPVEVDGRPLVREGRDDLFPFVGDLDGDGRRDLLLGTREDGRLLVYPNVGSNTNPRLSGPQWFDDTVPTGRIPRG
jgi:hypothetical protein